MFESSPPSIKFIALRQSFEADFCLARGVYDAEFIFRKGLAKKEAAAAARGAYRGATH